MRLLKILIAAVTLFWSTLVIYDSLFPPLSTLMVAQLFRLEIPHRQYVPLNRISPWLLRGAIAAEDGKFCTHVGVDWESLQHSVNATLKERHRVHGASTISMQVAKNLFLWPGRSYLRKAVEIPFAIILDLLWGKRAMMQAYLNIAEFGDGIYGVEAASRHYFGRSAATLSLNESALLIAALPNPRKRNPARPDGYVHSYASAIAGRALRGADAHCLGLR